MTRIVVAGRPVRRTEEREVLRVEGLVALVDVEPHAVLTEPARRVGGQVHEAQRHDRGEQDAKADPHTRGFSRVRQSVEIARARGCEYWGTMLALAASLALLAPPDNTDFLIK